MRLTKILVFILVWGSVSVLQAQVTLAPPFHSFGNIRPGKLYMLNVKITNNGNQSVFLGGLRADCSCTKAKLPKTILKPHASTTLMLHYQPPAEEKGWKTYKLIFKVYQQGDDKNVHSQKITFPYTAQFHPTYTLYPK